MVKTRGGRICKSRNWES